MVYIALRSFIAVFYNINLFGGFNILELSGFFFIVILIFYWVNEKKFEIFNTKYTKVCLFLLFWVSFSTLFYILSYGSFSKEIFSSFIRILNNVSVFIVFPLIFKNRKEIEKLINAFLITTLLPIVQGLFQIFVGPDIFGMATSLTRGAQSNYVMYYGFYHKYDWYANAALIGGLVLIYKTRTSLLNNKKKNLYYLIFYILYLMLASITLSRTLFISMAIITIFIFFNTKRKNKKISFVLILLLFISSGFFQSHYTQLVNRSSNEIKALKGEIPLEYSFHGRVSLWKDKLQNLNKSSFIEKMMGNKSGIGPHSDYVQWILSYGYIGISIYIFFILKLFFGSLGVLNNLIRRNQDYLRSYGLMVFAGLIIWIFEGFIHNVSQMPDYSYMIIGNISIFLAMSNRESVKDKETKHSRRIFSPKRISYFM
ncbi:MAG: hypothetical protein ACTSQG_04715 [Promethearchaeota archaeon]